MDYDVAIGWAAAGAACMALALLVAGWRGRRVGDHPYCRRCGFDLFGRPEGSMVCPECGTDLSRLGEIVTGVRRTRWKPLVLGVIILLPALAAVYGFGSGAARTYDWQKATPTWYLIRQTEGLDAARRGEALRELGARLAANKLSAAQVDRLVDRGLGMQGSPVPWRSDWGDFIEAARAAGQVSDEQWLQYAEQAVKGSLTLTVRPKLRRGDPLPHVLETRWPRVGRKQWSFIVRIRSLVVDQEEAILNLRLDDTLTPMLRGGSLPGIEHLLPALGDGMHHGHLYVEVSPVPPGRLPAVAAAAKSVPFPTSQVGPSTFEARRAARAAAHEAAMLKAAVATVQLRLPLEFYLTSDNRPALKAVDDENLRAAVEKSIGVPEVHATNGGMAIEVRCDRPPVDLSFYVGVQQGERYWPMGVVVCPKGERKTVRFESSFFGLGPIDGPAADVRLRPEAQAGTNTIDVLSFWSREIVLKDVPVSDDRSGQRRGP